MTRITKLSISLLALVILAGLVTAPVLAKKSKKKVPLASEGVIGWPPPPADPVIVYAGSYWGDLNFPESKKSKFKKKLLGEKDVVRRIIQPFDVAVDVDRERVYVSCRIFLGIFDIRNKIYAEFHGEPPYNLSYVTGVTVDSQGNLYCADARLKSVVVFDPELKPLRAYGGGDLMKHPVDVGVNEALGRLYVSDSKANKIHVFDLETSEFLFSFGKPGTGEGEFNRPSFLWVDHEGLVYVTDFLNFRVQGFDPDGEFLFSVGEIGVRVGQFSKPKGVAVNSEGHIYVVDAAFSNIQIFNREGRVLLPFSGFGMEPGQMKLPRGMFIDRNNLIYVCDSMNGRVSVFEFLGTPVLEKPSN